ncbi:MAG: hypothetical protein ABSB79_13750 [Syntrophales bacterium]|jgi:hypothetical protein
MNLIQVEKKSLNYTQSYISIVIGGRISFKLDKRTSPTSILWFNVKDDEKAEAIKLLLAKDNISYNINKYKDFVFNIDVDIVKNKSKLFQDIVKIRYEDHDTTDL